MKKIKYTNAGAGSGKTYRLTHLLADYLSETDPAKAILPSEVIVGTYTTAAAAEIKERARSVLLEQNMVQKAAQLDSAAIGTIHSVAQKFITKFWFLLGISPGQAVITDEDKKIYQNQSIAKMLLSKSYADERAAIDRYYRIFQPVKSGDNYGEVPYPEFWVDDLARMISKITYYGITDLEGSIQRSFDETDFIFDEECEVTDDAFKALFKQFKNEVEAVLLPLLKQLDEVTARKKNAEEQDKSVKGQRTPEAKAIRATAKAIIDDAKEIIKELKDAIKPLKDLPEKLKEIEKTEVSLTYPALMSLLDAMAFASDAGVILTDEINLVQSWLRSTWLGKIMKACIQAMFTLAQDWEDNYKVFKKNHGLIDYDDMEKYFYQLLQTEEGKDEIRNNYKLVMVDEFQDCNPMQLKIFDLISDLVAESSPLEQSSVWVGDPNQAIYGFRGSDTELIQRVASRFPEKENVSDANGLCKDSLDTSYRSVPSLVDLSNKLFGQHFGAMTALKANRPKEEELIVPVRHWHFEDKAKSKYYPNLAQQIKDLVESGEWCILHKDEKEPRPVEYKDIAVLTLSNSNLDNLVSELRKIGVPASAVEKKISERAEVQLVLALLNLSYHPANAHELATVLKLWAGWTTEDILESRADFVEKNPVKAESESVTETGSEAVAGSEAESETRAESAASSVPAWMSDCDQLGAVRVALKHAQGQRLATRLQTIITELRLTDHVRMWGDEDIRRRNLISLELVAERFQERCDRLSLEASVSEFIAYLQETEIAQPNENESATVKVLTYHRSKGLEWPVVLLDSLSNDIDSFLLGEFMGVHEVQLPNEDNALWPDYQLIYLPNAFFKNCPEAIAEDISDTERFQEAKDRVHAERTRLLYVGITRARDCLISVTYDCEHGSKKLIPLDWLKKIEMVPEEWQLPDASQETVDIWGLEEYSSVASYFAEYEEQEMEEDDRYSLWDLPELTEQKMASRTLHPSCLGKEGVADITLNKCQIAEPVNLKREMFAHDADDGKSKSGFGTCVHNIFAACPWTGASVSDAEKAGFTEKAVCILQNFGMDQVIDAKELTESLLKLYAYLEEKYGKAEKILHEHPFYFPISDGEQEMRGEIDLIWRTSTGDVIVDFKNHQGLEDNSRSYVPQLTAYKNRLEQAGHQVVGCVLHYVLQGEVFVW